MFGSHRPKVFRSRLGCCICGAKSSTSRFTSSTKYEEHFQGCFIVNEKRQGEICNACVLLVKRWSRLPEGSTKNWKHVSLFDRRIFNFFPRGVHQLSPIFEHITSLSSHFLTPISIIPQVVNSKASVKRNTRPRRASKSKYSVENGENKGIEDLDSTSVISKKNGSTCTDPMETNGIPQNNPYK